MAFNISEFKSGMNRFGGPARASLFEVQITPRASSTSRISSRELSFFCKNVAIPGMVFNATIYEVPGQMRKAFPMGWNPEPVQAIFMLDSYNQVLTFFHSWAQSIVNYGTTAGPFSEVEGRLPFEIGYKDEYSARITIRHYSADFHESGVFYEVILDNAFPIQMGDVDLAWENNDQYSVLPVSFQYDRIQFSGEKVGVPSNRGRGNGLLGLINSVGSVNSLVGSILPNSIQDALNQFTRTRATFDNISRQLDRIF